ncbi:hypothetical protein [Halorubrum amylolyticum]|uniref:hypothetical protein n=1 Tax=Halorubrum amylolyticum TaxID=2508724 RepID=UPI0013E8A85D|nr:hypothetical protein [Halorubrum amylolyticum]
MTLDALLTDDRTESQGNVAVSFTYNRAFVWVGDVLARRERRGFPSTGGNPVVPVRF